MSSRSTVAETDEGNRLNELQRHVQTFQRKLTELYQRVAYDDDDEWRTAAALGHHDAPPRSSGQSPLNGRECRASDSATRHHHCRLRTLDEKVEKQQQLMLQLQRQSPLNTALLDNMYQQQKRIAEVRQSVQQHTYTN